MCVLKARQIAQLSLAVMVALIGWGCGGGGGGTTPETQPDGTVDPTPTQRTVTGFIGDITSGQGVAQATITVGGASTSTDGSGLFTLPAVRRVDQTIQISATGYQTRPLSLTGSTDQINGRRRPGGVGDIAGPPDPVGT